MEDNKKAVEEGKEHEQPRRGEQYLLFQRAVDGLKAQKKLLKNRLTEATSKELTEQLQKKVEQVKADLKEYRGLFHDHQENLGAELRSHSDRLSKAPLYYSDYLQLDKVLNAQDTESGKAGTPVHDEVLFIITHQAYELWFKQILHELHSVVERLNKPYVPERDISRIAQTLHRVVEIEKVLVHQFDIMETMSSLDFMDFRDFLFPASGFQSFQFRLVENMLGMKSQRRVTYERKAYHTKLSPKHQAIVQEAEQKPNLFQVVEKWLERTPFLDNEHFKFLDSYKEAAGRMYEEDRQVILANTAEGSPERERELKKLEETETSFHSLFDEDLHKEQIAAGSRQLSFKATQAALLIWIYQEEPIFALPFRILTCLLDIDEQFTSWRYRHALMVHRMLGTKVGTGGSSGYWYLKSTIERGRVFSEIGNLATYLIPRRDLPALPPSMIKNVNFHYSTEVEEQSSTK